MNSFREVLLPDPVDQERPGRVGVAVFLEEGTQHVPGLSHRPLPPVFESANLKMISSRDLPPSGAVL